MKTSKGSGIHTKTVFFLFKNEDCEKRLQERLRICPFSGSREKEMAYTKKLEEELRENQIEQIHPDKAKWFNPTFIIPKLHQKWRKILDASALNKEIQTIHFKMIETDQVRDLKRKGDWATSLDLKSAFHHLIVYPPLGPYLAFEAMEKVYQYRAMPFGTQHSPIFFEQALTMVLTKTRGDIWMDNSSNEMRNRTKTTDQLPIVDLGLGKDAHKDDTPKKTGTTLLIKEIYQPNRETSPDQDKISSINNKQTEFYKSPGKRRISLPKVNGLSKNESTQEQRMEREYDSTQGNPSRALLVAVSDSDELRDDIRSENSRGSDGIRRISKGLGSDLELQTGDNLVQHREWNKDQKRWTSNKKETEAIYLGLFCYEQVFKELQIKAILIKSDSSTAIRDLAKQRAGQTLVAEVKKIVKLNQQLKIQTQTQHIPGISNKITQTLCRLSTQADYSIKKEIFIALCQAWKIIPTLDQFAIGENKLMNRYVARGEEDEEAEWLNAFSRPWKEEIFGTTHQFRKLEKTQSLGKSLNQSQS
ncbi:MAG: hypothetical protein EZS28_028722 [Streblomastix strix]|uniref:Reverse transcriptase domain-containing protein n=1 Tax=Streblomastix strix TaxID=222440 RepID=A0A5J4V110_9EUKA|nr:MAG: hypothetical protein EZS28_028722 [Streblomastix strix]